MCQLLPVVVVYDVDFRAMFSTPMSRPYWFHSPIAPIHFENKAMAIHKHTVVALCIVGAMSFSVQIFEIECGMK